MGVDKEVVENGIQIFFEKEKNMRRKEVWDIVELLKEKEEFKDEGIKFYSLDILEHELFKAIEYMGLAPHSRLNVTTKLQLYYVRLFLEFKKQLGYDEDQYVVDEPPTIVDEPPQTSRVQSTGPPKQSSRNVKKKKNKSTSTSKKSAESNSTSLKIPEKSGSNQEPEDHVVKVDKTNTFVFVSGPSLQGANSLQIKQAFQHFGKITKVTPNPNESSAVIQYKDYESKMKAIQQIFWEFRGKYVSIRETERTKKLLEKEASSSYEDALPSFFAPSAALQKKRDEDTAVKRKNDREIMTIEQWKLKMQETEEELLLQDAHPDIKAAFARLRDQVNIVYETTGKSEVFRTDEDFVIAVVATDAISLITRWWLDINIVTWFAMSLRNDLETKQSNKCEFLAPVLIQEYACIENPTSVQNYLMKAMSIENDKIFLAPYHSRGHWNLFIFLPQKRLGYILDSNFKSKWVDFEKNVHSYKLTENVEKVFPNMKINLVKECNQQSDGSQCGYYVLKWMHDFTSQQQDLLPEVIPWKTSSPFSKDELVDITRKCIKICDI